MGGGESVVAIGAGVTGEPLTWPVVVAALCGLAVSLTLSWVYFDVVALVAERVLTRLTGDDRTRLARDSYTYLHFPMLLGIVYSALALNKVLGFVSDTAHHDLGDALPWGGTGSGWRRSPCCSCSSRSPAGCRRWPLLPCSQ